VTPDENKALARRFLVEAFPRGEFEEVLAPDYRDHSAPPGTGVGSEAIKQLTEPYRLAFPDLHFEIEDQVAEGDKVVTRYTFVGTHTGPLMGLPPTGKRVRMPGISIYRVDKGCLAEAWVQYDVFGLLQELGAIPQPQGAGTS
jgi:steroid delta-isomerase-like uncharacterized protein